MANTLIGRKLTNVRLHAIYHVRGVGQIPTVLDTSGTGRFGHGLEMTRTDQGVLCKVTTADGKLTEFELFSGNIVGATYESDET